MDACKYCDGTRKIDHSDLGEIDCWECHPLARGSRAYYRIGWLAIPLLLAVVALLVLR